MFSSKGEETLHTRKRGYRIGEKQEICLGDGAGKFQIHSCVTDVKE